MNIFAEIIYGDDMAKERKDLKSEETWSVDKLYSSWSDWNKDLTQAQGKEVTPKWPEISKYKDKLQHSADEFISLLKNFFKTQRVIEKLFTYAHLRLDEDLGNDEAKNAYGKILAISHDFQYETSWIEPQVLEIPEKIFQKYSEDPELAPYIFYLEKIYRLKPHTLSLKEEGLLALSYKTLDTNYKAFSAFSNADLKFPKIFDSKQKEHELTQGLYSNYLFQKDRELRKQAFQTLHNTFFQYENTLSELLQGQVTNDLYVSRAKKYPNALSAALYVHNIDPKVYDNLIESTRRNLSLLHRYVRLRKKILNVDELHLYDMYAPLVEEIDFKKSYPEACQLVIDSVKPLGAEYENALKKGLFDDGWVDPYENERKRSGAYSSGCYDSVPYILLNFHGSLNDVLTLAHEAGHSMHSYLSQENQSYHEAKYPIFVAEVASTFNEQLLLQHLLEQSTDEKMIAYLLNYKLEGIRTTFFRQTMFAEFELKMHEWAEKQIPLTPSFLKEKYIQLNHEYFGVDTVIDKEVEIEWARIPHFYYNFYVYQYATGLSAAYALFKNVCSSKENQKKYLQFLQSGGSKYPLDLLKLAGVDMLQPSAMDVIFTEFEKLLNELERLTLKGGVQQSSV